MSSPKKEVSMNPSLMSSRPAFHRSVSTASPWSNNVETAPLRSSVEGHPAKTIRKGPPAPVAVFAPVPSNLTFYPTPPASPDLDVVPACLPPIGDLAFFTSAGFLTPPPDTTDVDHLPTPVECGSNLASSIPIVPLDSLEADYDASIDLEDSELEDLVEESSEQDVTSETDPPATSLDHPQFFPPSSSSRLERKSSSSSIGPIPIPILLNTSHDLPHASTFRLSSPSSLLSSLGGNRVLLLDASQTVWDRMPYSAATAAAALSTKEQDDEESVEAMIGGERDEGSKISGLQWGLRSKKSREHISSIFVHPPTPERETPPTTANVEDSSRSSTPRPKLAVGSPEIRPESPITALGLPDEPVASTSQVSIPLPPRTSIPTPIQVLPEVRSPPRRTIALAADSLQVAKGRGRRRPKLFGFTEISDSSSSANSSRQASPERDSTPTPTQLPPSFVINPPRRAPAPGTASTSLAPTRHLLSRTKSDTSLPTVVTKGSISPTPPFQPPKPKRGNGLKLDFTGIIPVASEEETESAVVPSPYSARLIRKKSGEILKPALKYAGPLAPNGTPLKKPDPIPLDESEIVPRARFESKSLPATPSCPKYVHFDTQLERVKLFLQDQKPQVVSRDASPTAEYTTSEGEEYPFPSTDEEDGPARKVLQIKLPNFPTSHPPDSELYLESLFLEEDRRSLRGMILCKNLAFQKWVAARFTLDFWQTTSEVTAQHKETVRGGAYDRFVFTIKLHDVLSRISEKTLFLALRYHTAGKEIWDSNGGQNYQVLFEKVTPPSPSLSPKRANSVIQPGMGKAIGGRTSQWSVTGGGRGDDRLADLRAKLSHLTGDDPDNSPPQASPSRGKGGPLSPHRGVISFGSAISPTHSPRKGTAGVSPDLPAAGPTLAARYDFGAALKNTRDGRRNSPSPNSQRLQLNASQSPAADTLEVRTGLISFPSSGKTNNGHAATEFYSPRFSPNKLPDNLPLAIDPLFSSSTGSNSPSGTPTPVRSVDAKSDHKPLNGFKISNGPASAYRESSPPVTDSDVASPTDDVRAAKASRPNATRSTSEVDTFREDSSTFDKDEPKHVEHVLPVHPGSSAGASILKGTAVANETPESSVYSRWSPTSESKDRKGDEMSNASYSSLVEQFCWGGASSSSPDIPRRSSSTSALNSYFDVAASHGAPYHHEISHMIDGSPHSTASFHTTFTSHLQGHHDTSPVSTRSYTSTSYGTPGSLASPAPPSHHRSSSFTSPMTNARGHMATFSVSPEKDTLIGMENEVRLRNLGAGRTPLAC